MSQALSRHGIGGSEAAAVLGLNPYQSPLALYLRKRAEILGEPDPFPVHESDAIRWGNYLEPAVRQAYADRYGVAVSTPPGSMFQIEHAWRRATPDGLIYSPGGGAIERGLEIKTASYRLAHLWGADGTDEVPPHYAVQCLWSMHVVGVEVWDLAVLIGGADFRCYRLRRDADLEREMIERVEDFWHRNVMGGVEPEIDGSDAITDYLVRKWPGTGEPLEADPDTAALVERIKTYREIEREAAAVLALAENELRSRIGDHSALEVPGLGKILCKPRVGRSSTDWPLVAALLADRLPDGREELERLKADHTRRAKPSRPLLYPREWSKGASEGES